MTLKKILLFIGLAILAIIAWSVYVFFENPYPRFSKFGKELKYNPDELSILNFSTGGDYYLIKKYIYSKDTWLIGFSSSTVTDDYYLYGVATENKILLPPKYEYIYSKIVPATQQFYLECMPYKWFGKSKVEYFNR